MTEIDQVNISVILPASGSGERFGSKPPKQFSKVLDRPLILHTILAFHRCSWINEILVPVSSCYLEYAKEVVRTNHLHKVTVIEGCQSRHRSIYAGIKHLKADSALHVVIIHDGVRVFAEESLIKDIALAAVQHGASGVVRPLVSTVVSGDCDSFLQESLDRTQYRASEMPQGFLYDIIKTAYEKATDFDFDYGTECLLLAKKYTGTKAKLIEGPDYLWKVTYKKDLFSAEELLKDVTFHTEVEEMEYAKHRNSHEEKLLQVRLHCESCTELRNAIVAKCDARKISVQASCSDTNHKKHQCNSHMYVYKHFDKSQMTENTECANSRHGTSDQVAISPTVIHVYHGTGLGDQDKLEYMSVCRQLSVEHGDTLVYGVICEENIDYDKLSELVVDILWNRTKSMSGQTFILNQ